MVIHTILTSIHPLYFLKDLKSMEKKSILRGTEKYKDSIESYLRLK